MDQNGVTLRDPANHDARLTPFGEQQCEALSLSLRRDGRVAGATLVVTSPLTRCVQTALLCFEGRVADDARFVAHESVRETLNFACDARRGSDALTREFASRGVDFSLVVDPEDAIDRASASPYARDPLWRKYEAVVGDAREWDDHRESCDLVSVADRARAFFAWLETRDEREVAVSSHSAFMRCLFSWGHAGGVRAAPEQTLWRVGGAADEGDAGPPVVTYGTDARSRRACARTGTTASSGHSWCVIDDRRSCFNTARGGTAQSTRVSSSPVLNAVLRCRLRCHLRCHSASTTTSSEFFSVSSVSASVAFSAPFPPPPRSPSSNVLPLWSQ